MTPEEILTKAADLIDAAPKLAKGVFTAYAIELDEQGHESGLNIEWDEVENAGPPCFCTIGAIHRALNTSPIGNARRAEIGAVLSALQKAIGLGDLTLEEVEGQIYFWNDNPDRTKDDVVQTLRAAAEVARVRAS